MYHTTRTCHDSQHQAQSRILDIFSSFQFSTVFTRGPHLVQLYLALPWSQLLACPCNLLTPLSDCQPNQPDKAERHSPCNQFPSDPFVHRLALQIHLIFLFFYLFPICSFEEGAATMSLQYTAQLPSSAPRNSSPPHVPGSPFPSQHRPTPPQHPLPYPCLTHRQTLSHPRY